MMLGRPTATLEPVVSSAPPIDPRLRARRIEVRRVEGRRRLQRLVDMGLLAMVVAAFLGALWTPLLDVDEVRVEGAGAVVEGWVAFLVTAGGDESVSTADSKAISR